ncbi:MAG: uroporphyrinogen decarboxylase family protein [Anaerolineae bacterium]|nr:uroporphyrinogen decarboxylase family protein [Anaerolineae bacterium]
MVNLPNTVPAPDYRRMVDVAYNRRPDRLPVYEHLVNVAFMEKATGTQFEALAGGDDADLARYFEYYCGFYHAMTYDTVSFEVCITEILPGGGALLGEHPGPVQTRADFDRYPWDELPQRFWAVADRRFRALAATMPPGMKALGGVGNGIFEISEDLVGYEHLAYMSHDDPELYADLYRRIGDLMVTIWSEFLDRYADLFAVCRVGDDQGYKVSTLVAPHVIRQHMVPQYRRVIDLVHRAGRPFLWHSCGNIFAIMDDMIDAGIDAKHSNEDVIAPFGAWIERFGDRIGLVGGIDVDILCRDDPQAVFERAVEMGRRFRSQARGYALGSGNSIPDYVPVEGYMAMIRAAEALRAEELIVQGRAV